MLERESLSYLLLLVAALLACGGGREIKTVRMPDGHDAFAADCGARTTCYEWMGDQCPAGYRVLDATGVRDDSVAERDTTDTEGAEPLKAYRKRIQVIFRCR